MSKILIVVPPTERDSQKMIGFEDFYEDAVKKGMFPINDLQAPIKQLSGLTGERMGLLDSVDAIWFSSIYGINEQMAAILMAAKQKNISVERKWELNITQAFSDAYNFISDNYKPFDDISNMDAYWDQVVKYLNDSESGGLVNPLRIKLLTGSINFLEAVVKKEIMLDMKEVKPYLEREFKKTLKGFRAHYFNNTKPSLSKIKEKKESLCDCLSEGIIVFLNDCEFKEPLIENKKIA